MKKQILAAAIVTLAFAAPAMAAPMDYNNDAGSAMTTDKTTVDSDSTTMSDGVNTTTHKRKMVRHRSSATTPSINNNTLNETDTDTEQTNESR